jgi:hypothetical protein
MDRSLIVPLEDLDQKVGPFRILVLAVRVLPYADPVIHGLSLRMPHDGQPAMSPSRDPLQCLRIGVARVMLFQLLIDLSVSLDIDLIGVVE